MTRPIAIYSRVSTDDQDHEAQESVIVRWIESSGLDMARVGWYRDTESGDRMSRAEMERLERDIFEGKVKTVVCYKLDRLSRNMLDGMAFVGRICDRGCRLISVTQHIDVTGVMGKMMAAMLFGFAEMEQQTRRERQAAGIAVARRQGVYTGRKPGTTKGKPARAVELRAKGLTAPEIATALGVSTRTVWTYLGKDVPVDAGPSSR